MKTKCVSKYVYRKMLDGSRVRTDNMARTLIKDFPKIAIMFEDCYVISVTFNHVNGDGDFLPAKAWYDKHGNIVVRIFHEDKQTRINFY